MIKDVFMNHSSTMFLRGAVITIGAIVLGLCVFALPAIIGSGEAGYYTPILIGMYVTTVPFFFALYQALKLLGYIDKNQAFSEAVVKALAYIKYSAAIISALYIIGMPYIYYAADRDDAPGVIVIGLVITFASLVIAVFAAVLQTLLRSALDIKSENDLTV